MISTFFFYLYVQMIFKWKVPSLEETYLLKCQSKELYVTSRNDSMVYQSYRDLPWTSSVAALFEKSLNQRLVCDSCDWIEGCYIVVQGVNKNTVILLFREWIEGFTNTWRDLRFFVRVLEFECLRVFESVWECLMIFFLCPKIFPWFVKSLSIYIEEGCFTFRITCYYFV